MKRTIDSLNTLKIVPLQQVVNLDVSITSLPSINISPTLPQNNNQRATYILACFTYLTGKIQSHALKFGSQKINLHISGHEFEPKAARVQPGSGDLCFITEHSVDDVLRCWTEAGIEV